MVKIVLSFNEPGFNPNSEELSNIVITRLGLTPRKSGSTEKMNRVLIELYERSKRATREKNPKFGVLTVEEMASFAGITRQTMYEYLRRWLTLDLISKTSYIGPDSKVVIGYRLNGTTLESAFEKSKSKILSNLEMTQKYIQELQKIIKNEKISQSQKEKT